MGLGKPKLHAKFEVAGFIYYGSIRESVFKRQIRFFEPLFGELGVTYGLQLSNYRPISNLSLLSKIIERVVKSRLTHHLSSNNLFNPNQSAYCKHHSTETAPVSYTHLTLPTNREV